MLHIEDFLFPLAAQNAGNVQGEIIILCPQLAQHLNRADVCPEETISSQDNPYFGVIGGGRVQIPSEAFESDEE